MAREAYRAWLIESASRFTRRRETLGLSQRGLARVAGTSQQNVNRIEAAKFEPRYELKLALARALKVTPKTIWGESDD